MSINVKSLCTLDARSLGVFRIFLGLLTLSYFAQVMTYWGMYFSNQGVLPASIATSHWYHWSIFYILPESFHTVILVVALIFSALYTLGIWHRPATFLLYVLMISVQHRNLGTVQVGNALHASLLFCSFFLPLSSIWSLSDRATFKKTNFQIYSAGVPLLLGQISALYLFAFLFKWNDLWIWSGDGLYTSLSYSVYIRPLGEKLLLLPWLLPLLTWFTQFARLLGGLAVWFPNAKLRGGLVILFFTVHIVFALTMTIGLFPYVCLAAWTALIPTSWWNIKKQTETIVKNREPKWIAVGASVALVLILAINVVTFLNRASLGWNWSQALGLYQRWSMFAELPKEHRWVSVLTRGRDGQYTQSKYFNYLSENTWSPVSSLYSSEISRRFHEMFVWERRPERVRAYADYICKFLGQKGEKPEGVLLNILGANVQAPQLPPYKYQIVNKWKFDCP